MILRVLIPSHRSHPLHSPSRLRWGLLQMGLGTVLVAWGWGEPSAIAQSTANLTFVLTRGVGTTVHRVPGYSPRYSGVVGSGELVVNGQHQVTGYYFTIHGLEPRRRYVYRLYAATNGSMSTSCEGDTGLVPDETAGEIVTRLGAIAPLRPTARGYAFVGSASQPVQLPEPVAISSIGYISIHPVISREVGSGIICANVRLEAGRLTR